MLCSEVPVTTVVVSPQLSSYSNGGEENRREGEGRKTEGSVGEEREEEERVIRQHEAIRGTERTASTPGLCKKRTPEAWALGNLHTGQHGSKTAHARMTLRVEGIRDAKGAA